MMALWLFGRCKQIVKRKLTKNGQLLRSPRLFFSHCVVQGDLWQGRWIGPGWDRRLATARCRDVRTIITEQHEQAADHASMERAQSGDLQALGQLYERYATLVMSVGLRILHDAGEAQDLVQEVFLYMFRKRQDFDPAKSPLRTWLLQIAYSRAFNKRKYLTRRRFYDLRDIENVLDSLACDCSPERIGQRAELRKLLYEALRNLSEQQRTTLELFFWEGYSLREISVRLQETLPNTRQNYYRGLAKLRATVRHKDLGTLARNRTTPPSA